MLKKKIKEKQVECEEIESKLSVVDVKIMYEMIQYPAVIGATTRKALKYKAPLQILNKNLNISLILELPIIFEELYFKD